MAGWVRYQGGGCEVSTPPAQTENLSQSIAAYQQPEDPFTGPSGRSLGGGVFLYLRTR